MTVTAPSQKQADELLRSTRIDQSQDEEGWSLETRWPGMHGNRGKGADCPRCRVVARYELTVPPGVDVALQTVNGDVKVRDLDGEVKLESVNGRIEAAGSVESRSRLRRSTGRSWPSAQAVGRDSSLSLESVNGAITLTLPKNAQFDLSGRDDERHDRVDVSAAAPGIGGYPQGLEPLVFLLFLLILLFVLEIEDENEAERRIVVTDENGVSTEVDLDALDAELSESLGDRGRAP